MRKDNFAVHVNINTPSYEDDGSTGDRSMAIFSNYYSICSLILLFAPTRMRRILDYILS